MTDNSGGRSVMIGVLTGALIVIAVGGGILYATGALDPAPTNITIQQPAAAPAPAPTVEKDGRRGEWRGDRRDNDRDRDDRRPDRR